MKNCLCLLLVIVGTRSVMAQDTPGKIYLTWGYHRDAYTKSTIHFKDNKTDPAIMQHYDFKYENASARDRLDAKNFFRTPLTVPQYVLNIGYLFKNSKWGIEGSWDHLKYIVNDNQKLHVTGFFGGQYHDVDTIVNPQFVHFEHTNGNNYLMISAVRHYSVFPKSFFGDHLEVLVKAGAGLLIPKTQSDMFTKDNDGPFRISGFVIGASASLRYTFLKYMYLEASTKGAFADYTNVKLYEQGRAKHHFFSVQAIAALGVAVPL